MFQDKNLFVSKSEPRHQTDLKRTLVALYIELTFSMAVEVFRIIECYGLEGTFRCRLAQPPAVSRNILCYLKVDENSYILNSSHHLVKALVHCQWSI